MKTKLTILLPLLFMLIFAVLGADRAQHYRKYKHMGLRNQRLVDDLKSADAVDDPDEAINLYQDISPMEALVQLRILERQWAVAIGKIDRIKRVKSNSILSDRIPMLYRALADHLDDMNDTCSYLLTEFEPLSEDIAWRVYNIRGAVHLMDAFIVLETEKNWKKVKGTMKEAITDLKSAIEIVDRTDGPVFEKNIPRWNMDLLQGEDFVKMIKLTKVDSERRLDLRDNLEAIIPEKGGYAPGEPVDRHVKK